MNGDFSWGKGAPALSQDISKPLNRKQLLFVRLLATGRHEQAFRMYAREHVSRLIHNARIQIALNEAVKEYMESEGIERRDLVNEYHSISKDKKAPASVRAGILKDMIDKLDDPAAQVRQPRHKAFPLEPVKRLEIREAVVSDNTQGIGGTAQDEAGEATDAGQASGQDGQAVEAAEAEGSEGNALE